MRNNISDAESFFETASKEELIDFLVKTIHNEVSKGDDADCDLVRECSDWLDELTEDEIVFTPEELERKLAQLKAGSQTKPAEIRKKAKLKTFVRVALIAAAIFAISLVSLSAVAVNKGYDSAWEYISVNVGKVLGLELGQKLNHNEITFTKYSELTRYSSMSELLEKENIDILYPKSMPTGISINEVNFVQKTDDTYMLCFTFSNIGYVFNISNYYLNDISSIETYERITIDNLDFYINKKEENVYYAVLQHEGLEYTIQTPNYDDLIIIINNMKG